MAWVCQKGDLEDTATMVKYQEKLLGFEPRFWVLQHCPCTGEGKKRKRSEELEHCMLNFYTGRYHEDQERAAHYKRLAVRYGDRIADLAGQNASLAASLRATRAASEHLMAESAQLIDLLIDTMQYLDPQLTDGIRGQMRAITAPLDAIIDLTADEDLE